MMDGELGMDSLQFHGSMLQSLTLEPEPREQPAPAHKHCWKQCLLGMPEFRTMSFLPDHWLLVFITENWGRWPHWPNLTHLSQN